MLYFCSVDDVKEVLAVAPRYDNTIDEMRKTVTEEMTAYMRRDIEYAEGIVEYFDTDNINPSIGYNVWLDKKNVDPASVIVNYAIDRIWSADNVIPPENMIIDIVRGRITLYGPTLRYPNALRISYSGGYKGIAITPATDPITYTDVMDCPAKVRNAAVSECSFRLDKLLNVNVGNSTDNNTKLISPQRKFISGLLSDTAFALADLRKPLGRVSG